jgi:hypothetical protein
MNTSRRILLLFLFVSVLTAGLWAQRTTPTITGDKELVELLQLTPEQAAQIEALEAETEAKMAAHREAGQAARKEARGVRQDHSRTLNSILTEEQQEQLRSYRMGQREERREVMKSVDWEGLRAELKAYRENTIEPVLRSQRAKLDRKLSKDDRATVATLQEELAAIRAEDGAMDEAEELEEMEEAEEAQDVEELEEAEEAPAAEAAAKPNRRRAREGQQPAAGMSMETREVAAELAAKYGDRINELFAEIAPQREQWKADQEAIRAKYLPERPERPAKPGEVGEEKIEQRNISFLLMKTE